MRVAIKIPCLVLGGILLAGSVAVVAADNPAGKTKANGKKSNEPVLTLEPFNVSAGIFPRIEVHFRLSGENLNDTLEDPILEAYVTNVHDDGMGLRMGILVGDSLVRLNGTEIRGLTINQLAAMVKDLREKKEDLVWDMRRGLMPFTKRFNGKWDTPLPGDRH